MENRRGRKGREVRERGEMVGKEGEGRKWKGSWTGNVSARKRRQRRVGGMGKGKGGQRRERQEENKVHLAG